MNFFMANIRYRCEWTVLRYVKCLQYTEFVKNVYILYSHVDVCSLSLFFIWKSTTSAYVFFRNSLLYSISLPMLSLWNSYLPLIFSYKWNSFIIECMLTGNVRSILYRLGLTRNLFSWGLSLFFFLISKHNMVWLNFLKKKLTLW